MRPKEIKWREPIDFIKVFEQIGECGRSLWQGLSHLVGGMGLKAKLVGIMLALTFTGALLLFFLDSAGVRDIAEAIQNQNEDLSQAFQISFEEITTQGFTNQARLQDFVATLKRKGVKEISILSNERQVLESSNPNKVGKVIPPKHKDFLITGAIGDEASDEGGKRKTYNLVVPVVTKGEQLGYVNLKLHLEDFDTLLKKLRIRRLVAIVLVFGIGVVGAIFLATRYTKPIGALLDSARCVAHGDLGQKVIIPVNKRDEIGELTATFNEMVEKLRENQELQKRLARSEQLSQLGQLSAGIAHEIRNPLNYLSLGLDHLRDSLASEKDQDKIKEQISRMKQEVLRLSHLIKNFLNYGKPLKLDKMPVKLSWLIDDSLRMVENSVSDRKIRVKKVLGHEIVLFGDREHLKSCFTNVMLNAVQAVSNGGSLDISAGQDRSSAVIKFKDDGMGIDEAMLKKVGEPFFTTKEGGVGVGLAITKKILAEHDGQIEIESERGKGTIVKITIPVIEG